MAKKKTSPIPAENQEPQEPVTGMEDMGTDSSEFPAEPPADIPAEDSGPQLDTPAESPPIVDGEPMEEVPPEEPAVPEDQPLEAEDALDAAVLEEGTWENPDEPSYTAHLNELEQAAPLELEGPANAPEANGTDTYSEDDLLLLMEDGDLPPEVPDEPSPGDEASVQPVRMSTRADDRRRERILTIDAHDEVQTEEEREATIWHEIQNAYRTRRILTGTLDAVEDTPTGMTVVVVIYKGFRVLIPIKEMLLYTGRMPSGREYAELMERLKRILSSRIYSEIDFIVKGIDNKKRSIVASRKDAMYRKRQTFYMDIDETGLPMIYAGRVVQARVIAVAEKVIRVEVFGVESTIVARGLSWEWIGNAKDHYSVGDRILVRVLRVNCPKLEEITIQVDVRSLSSATSYENLKKCVPQGRYAGRVTDVRNGVVFIRLNNGVNAIAHSCFDMRTPGKKDDVSFAVTRLDAEQGVAVGIITRIVKQNL